MNSKSLLIAIAALALTATGAQAFSSNALMRADLTDSERAAFSEARELQREGNPEAARDVLVKAGIDETVIDKIRRAAKHHRRGHGEDIEAALEVNDYNAFKLAIADTPLSDIITSEGDFVRFKEAHDLHDEGNMLEAKHILDDLGVLAPRSFLGLSMGMGRGDRLEQLSDTQRDAFEVARRANDREAMRAILVDAGITDIEFNHQGKRMRDGRMLSE